MPTYTNQPAEASALDTFIYSLNPTDNPDIAAHLYIGESNAQSGNVGRSLIKDPFTGIPTNASVISATLTLTPKTDLSSNARTMRVYRLKRAWVESEVTWNIYSTGNNWQTAGGFGSDDCEQTDIGSVSIAANQTLNVGVDISLTPSAITEMINGSLANNGWLIKMDTESNDAYEFYSSNDATASYRPKLVIEYTLPQTSGKPIFANFGIV